MSRLLSDVNIADTTYPSWVIRGYIVSIDDKHITISTDINGYEEDLTTPITPSMPGWLMCNGVSFRVTVPRHCARTGNLDSVVWGEFMKDDTIYEHIEDNITAKDLYIIQCYKQKSLSYREKSQPVLSVIYISLGKDALDALNNTILAHKLDIYIRGVHVPSEADIQPYHEISYGNTKNHFEVVHRLTGERIVISKIDIDDEYTSVQIYKHE